GSRRTSSGRSLMLCCSRSFLHSAVGTRSSIGARRARQKRKRYDVVPMLLKFLSSFLLLQYTLSVDVDLAVFNITVLDSAHRPAAVAFTSNVSELRTVLLQTRPEGTTALYDALELALGHLKDGSRQRKALVLLSDGGDNASAAKLDEVLRRAQQSSATIYCIGIYDPFAKDKNPGVLKKIAKVTGGESYFPTTSADLREIWPRIAGAIRGQYTIAYISSNPTHDGSYRTVKIIARDKRGKALQVRTR